MDFPYDVCVVGGCGHVGLPLALTFADHRLKVCIHDINDAAIEVVKSGRMPFLEQDGDSVLQRVLGRTLTVVNDPTCVSRSQHVIIVIGTPVDEHLNPTFHAMRRFFDTELLPNLADGQCVILRSTVFPGTTAKLSQLVSRRGRDVCVAFCPERVAEGKAMDELASQPQIVSGCDRRAEEMAAALFGRIARSVTRMTPLEAELTKIFTNVWRYIQFATANQFFMIAADQGLDFYRIYDAMTRDYPRMAGLPRSGFAAGPSLFKDTMQLAAAANNSFALGHAAMLINEGMPNFIVPPPQVAVSTRSTPRRYPWHGVQERQRRPARVAFVQAAEDPRIRGRCRALHRRLHQGLLVQAVGGGPGRVGPVDPWCPAPGISIGRGPGRDAANRHLEPLWEGGLPQTRRLLRPRDRSSRRVRAVGVIPPLGHGAHPWRAG